MTIKTTFKNTDEYMYVRCTGTFDMESMREVYTASVVAAAKAALNAVLIDVRGLRGEPPTILQRFELGVFVANLQRGLGRGIMIAGVGDRPMVHEFKFGEVVARNRSANARIFTAFDEAVEWIRSEQAFS